MKKLLLIAFVCLVLLLSGCPKKKAELGEEIKPSGLTGEEKFVEKTGEEKEQTTSSEHVTEKEKAETSVSFKTRDGFELVGDYYPVKDGAPAVILLHMLSLNRFSWEDFIDLLKKNEFNVLAIDSRGHGESLKQNDLVKEWKEFSEQDFKDMKYDVEAAKQFLLKQKIDKKKIFVVGASIGANTALIYSAGDKQVAGVVMLSGSTGYKGETTEDAIVRYGERPILLIASKDDEFSATSSQTLAGLAKGEKELKLYDTAGHGTNMFNVEQDLMQLIVDWLKAH